MSLPNCKDKRGRTKGLRCPGCGKINSFVVDSRAVREYVYRRRECAACGRRFSTREFAVLREGASGHRAHAA